MLKLLRRFLMLFRSSTPVPAEYRRNFFHLYMEIAWFGIVSGTTLSFLSVYATRQGANPFQIGLLSAAPALVNLLFALPAGSWISSQSIGKATFWSAVFTRIFYAVFVFLPAFLLPETQVWLIILITLVMTIPGTSLVVGFNALFAEAVPVEWRGQVVGVRNAILSVVTVLFTLIAGQILERVAFPTGYQIVFGLGVVGVLMSTLHLYFLSNIRGISLPASQPAPVTADSSAGLTIHPQAQRQTPAANKSRPAALTARRLSAEIDVLLQRGLRALRLDVMSGGFARLMGLLFFWHTMQFLTIPLVTPYIVNVLNLTDQDISLANALFNLTVFLGSLRLSQATRRFGNKTLTGGGIIGLAVFPILTALATGPELYILANLIGGLAWAMAGGALYNFILERSPNTDRPAYLAWYSLVSNGAILIGALAGPAIADLIGAPTALMIFGIGRLLAGAAIWKWG